MRGRIAAREGFEKPVLRLEGAWHFRVEPGDLHRREVIAGYETGSRNAARIPPPLPGRSASTLLIRRKLSSKPGCSRLGAFVHCRGRSFRRSALRPTMPKRPRERRSQDRCQRRQRLGAPCKDRLLQSRAAVSDTWTATPRWGQDRALTAPSPGSWPGTLRRMSSIRGICAAWHSAGRRSCGCRGPRVGRCRTLGAANGGRSDWCSRPCLSATAHRGRRTRCSDQK